MTYKGFHFCNVGGASIGKTRLQDLAEYLPARFTATAKDPDSGNVSQPTDGRSAGKDGSLFSLLSKF